MANKSTKQYNKLNPTVSQPRKSPEGKGKVAQKVPTDKNAGMSLRDQCTWWNRYSK